MAFDFLLLGLGLTFAACGGELFVRGLVGLAAWARIPAGVIGTTVAAFATSSPELTVAITAASDGRPEIALGDALGSNIVNIGLVVGIVLIMGTATTAEFSRRDATVALAMALVLFVLIVDGEISQSDGAMLLIGFCGWLVWTVGHVLEARSAAASIIGERTHARAVLAAFAGLVFLVLAGRSLVTGAKSIGDDLGISTFVIGVILVSLGTSLPELATAIVARVRGHTELGLGAAVGSNIFNTSFIIGITAVIAPIDVVRRDVSISLLFGAALIPVLLVGTRHRPLRRWRGGVLVGAYAASVLVLLAVQG